MHPELAARLTALEHKVGLLFAELGLVEPGLDEATAGLLGARAAALAGAGDRTAAIRAVMVDDGVAQAVAIARVDGFLRARGR